MTGLCSSLEFSIWFASILNSLKTNISCVVKLVVAMNRLQIVLSLYFGKKKIMKIYFAFKKNSLIILKINNNICIFLNHIFLIKELLFLN